ncbi:hypothetical protein TCAL_17121 [Tigriopus californicus]|uniref:Ig-like domain-containing protein n=1 Tax=Tigriopus californicus TaxID=6832 RepID=A0A553P2T5_TIGCA|nr:hypothetical protein TCAL_17121 [Tigriopus californicus]
MGSSRRVVRLPTFMWQSSDQDQDRTVMCVLGLCLYYVSVVVEARQQHFRVRPHDVEVASGGTAVITCEVGNRAGRVQWTKDGLTLVINQRPSKINSDNQLTKFGELRAERGLSNFGQLRDSAQVKRNP